MKASKIILNIFMGLLVSCSNHEQKIYTLNKMNSSKVYTSAKADITAEIHQISIQIDFFKSGKSYLKKRKFVKKNNDYYELYVIKYFDSNYTDTIYLFSLSLKDTSYNQEIDYDKANIIAPKGFYDWNVEVKKQSNGKYLLTKKHLDNSNQKEQIYYDEKFNISKIILFNSTDTLMLEK